MQISSIRGGILIISFFISFSYCRKDTSAVSLEKNARIDEWFAIDKAQHFMYSTFVALGSQYALVNKLQMKEETALPISSLLSFSAGLLKEINDKKGRNGFFSKKDMIANSFGIFFAGIFIAFYPP